MHNFPEKLQKKLKLVDNDHHVAELQRIAEEEKAKHNKNTRKKRFLDGSRAEQEWKPGSDSWQFMHRTEKGHK